MKRLAHILLFLLPFHAVLATFLRFEVGLENAWLWKELLLILLFIINLGFQELKDLKSAFSNKLSLLIVGYSVFLAISVLWAPDISLMRLFLGAKYDVFLFVALFAGLSFGSLSKKDFEEMLKWTFFGGLAAFVFGLFLHFVVRPENFTMFGYRNDWSTHIAGDAPAFCQKIENSELCRFQGTFAGPNQAAFYALLFIPICVHFLKRYKQLAMVGIIAAVSALFFTFSRSGWLAFGLELVLILTLMVKVDKKYLKAALGTLLILGVIAVLAMPDLVLRPLSNSEHLSQWMQGLRVFINSPIYGFGLGTAGPASRLLAEIAVIPESWFLQLAIEGGIIAAGLFIAIYYELLKRLWKDIKGVGLVFIIVLFALLIPSQLLHVFEDSSLTYSLFFLLGMKLVAKA